MDVYQTEEQQVDAIKAYWKKNGNAIIAGLVIGFSGFIGFNLYKDNQNENELAIAEQYQSVLEASTQDEKAFSEAATKFVADNGDSNYATLAALALAKEVSVHKDWPQVEKHLATAVANAKDEGIKAIATVRLARVQVQQDNFDGALNTLSATLPESFNAAVEEIKGDIYVKQGKNELARNAYQAAVTAGGSATSSALQMKLDDLAVATNLN